MKNAFNMIETMIKNEKINENEIDENEITTSIQKQKQQNENNNNKNKKNKKNKNKKNENKDLNIEIKNEIENNKKVDDFIKSIKAKKEIEKKEKLKENLKMNFFNKYKYLFILDPTLRLKLRNNEISIDEEIINDLFSMIKKNDILEKEILKDSCILIDSLNEIIYSNNFEENLINNFISNNINLINEYSNQIENENENYFILICNILYSLIKLKIELNKEIEINIEKFYEIVINNIKKNLNDFKDFNIKSNNNLINNLLLYFLITIFKSDNNEIIENLINNFLENIINNINIKEENLDKFKILFFNVKFILRLFNIFEIKKDKFYSLNIKTTKFIENNFNNIQENIIKLNSKKYLKIIFYVIKIYIFNMDLYYYLETNLFDDFFNLIKIITEKEPFINEFEEKKLFFKDFELNTLSFNSDDGISNYCMILMKLFKFFDKDNFFDVNIYTEYFEKIIEIVFDIKQKYLLDKYLQLLNRELNSKINIEISNKIFNFILNKIINIQKNIKEIKNLKEFIQFYKKFDLIKNNVIDYIKNVNNSEIKEQINILFLLSFFNKNDKKIEELINNIEFNKICFLKLDIINFLLHYYVNDEINNLNEIINIFKEKFKKKVEDEIIKELLNNINEKNVNKLLDTFKIIDLEKIKIPIDEIIKMKNESNFKLIDILILYYLNNNNELNENIENNNKFNVNLIDEIEEVNNKKKNYKKNYLDKNINNLLSILIECLKINNKLNENPNYFQIEDIIIEDKIDEKNKDENNNNNEKTDLIEMIKIQSEKKPNENEQNVNENNNEKNKEENENKKNNLKEKKNLINLEIILIIFNEILTLNEFQFSQNLNENKFDNEYLINYFYFSQIENFIYKILSNSNIFIHLTQNSDFLSNFMKNYISYKKIFDLDKSIISKNLSDFKNNNINEITKNLQFSFIISKCDLFLTNLIILRCSNQLVFLFSETEIFSLLHSNNRKFLKSIIDNLNNVYKTKILNQENIEKLLKLAQDENEDYLEDVVYKIFGKETIEYLQNPKDIIDFLTIINEGMHYDLLPEKKQYYKSIFSYFYIWKGIMSKIENGFKLYTSDKNYVKTIENYKILLKFVIRYLEHNSKLYEIFLLIVVSLIHLIEQQDLENNIDDSEIENNMFELFNEDNLTDNFDHNTYMFLLSILFKFVKIFPSLVKYYYDESKTKLKNIFKNLICSKILPKLLDDLRERIKFNKKILSENNITLNDFVSKNYLEFNYILNEEIKFLIMIKIPPIFPLKKLDINIKSNAQIGEGKMLNMKMNLNYTLNNSIDNVCDNLIIWGEDVKQLVLMGNEPCPICYFYLNITDKTLPSLQCHQCQKKFHKVCIKEWFKSQADYGKETCPMCRLDWKMKAF